MRKTADILGIPVDSVTMGEAVGKVVSFLSENKLHAVYTPNSEIIMAARRDPSLKEILRQADLLIPDGAGVVLAARILGRNLPQKVAGIDLVKNSFSACAHLKTRFFLLGGKPGVAEDAAKNIIRDYPGVEISGFRHGYFSPDEEKDVIEQINSSSTDILLVALGAPKQEKWIHKHKADLKVKVCIGIGGTLDVLSGRVRLAPEFFRRNGLEWLYRLCMEPRRYKRMMYLPAFILIVLRERIRPETK